VLFILELGCFFNIKTKNLSGKEAIPNIEFWRNFPEFVQEGLSKTVATTKEGVGWVKGKIQGKESNYNEF